MHGEIKNRFDSCFNVSQKKGCPPSINDGLELYGLLKQIKRGDIDKPQPSAFNLVARAKWEAWNKKKGLAEEQAMLQFVDTVRKAYSCSC